MKIYYLITMVLGKRFSEDIFNNRKRQLNNDKDALEIEKSLIYTVGNEIYFTYQVNDESITKIIQEITKIVYRHKKRNGKKKKLNITYIVDSPGGSAFSILKFYDFLNVIRKKNPNITFTSVLTGLVASAGTIMCTIADTRLMTRSAQAMIHELSSGTKGKFTELISYTKSLHDMHNKLMDIYLEKCKVTKEELEVLLSKESWFTSSEYLEKGFVDAIAEDYYEKSKDSKSDSDSDSDSDSNSDPESSDEFSDFEKNVQPEEKEVQKPYSSSEEEEEENDETDSYDSDNESESSSESTESIDSD